MKNILIVDDILEARRWLSEVAIAAFPPPHSITTAISRAEARAAMEATLFDVALIDLGLPDGSGIDLLRTARRRNPDMLCIVTTIMADDAHIVGALSAGASGYLLKEQRTEMVVRQLSQIADGIPALSPSIARRIMEHFRLTGPAAEDEHGLTAREQDVLARIGRGLRNLEVAEDLGIAEGTVAHHIKAIYRKLGISSRAEASWHATRLGLSHR